MAKSINFFHNENKILSTFDNVFFVKHNNEWEEIRDKKIFKGNINPNENVIKDSSIGDYYISYNTVYNLLDYSENFTKGWTLNNVSFKKMNKNFPISSSQKMIPSKNLSKHNISYTNISLKSDTYCFSIYVSPQEYESFQITISNVKETYGLKGIYKRRFDTKTRKYFTEYELKELTHQHSSKLVYDENTCIGIENLGENIYRVYLSCNIQLTDGLKVTFSILKNENSNLVEEFSNNTLSQGLLINAAQLTNTEKPTEYLVTNGVPFSYNKFSRLYLKERENDDHLNEWHEFPEYNSVYYNNGEPKKNIGLNDDLYFMNPIIKLGEIVRFGKNPIYRCWKNGSTKYYTKEIIAKIGDDVYEFSENDEGAYLNKVGNVTGVGKSNNISYININNNNVKYLKDDTLDDRLIKTEGAIFWNTDEDTYGYIKPIEEIVENGEGGYIRKEILKIVNLKYNNTSLYDKKKIIDALTYSTNLFMETWNNHYSLQPHQFRFGFNTGGHGNYYEYNNLRRFY